jgi:hypothetical protein
MPDHETKSLAPGSLAPCSGVYEQVGPRGRTGTQVNVLAGQRLPQTVDPAVGWELIGREKRRPPEMQVVTKGWWTLKEERAAVEELEKEDRDERR